MLTQEKIKLEPLPYQENALEPYISSRTISFHYGKHHKKYVETANQLLEQDQSLAGLSSEEIIRKTARQADKTKIFNNVAQAWNHDFYWKSMKPKGGGAPQGHVLDLLKDSFGDLAGFKEKFVEAAASQFGSGYAWIVFEKGKLIVTKTSNAENPLTFNQKPVLNMDVWEHAYYLDYQNLRKKYAETFVDHLINWDFVEKNLEGSHGGGN